MTIQMTPIKNTILLGLILTFIVPSKSVAQTYNSAFDEPSDILFEILLYLSVYPLVGNYNTEDHLYNNLTDYPYKQDKTGNYIDSDISEKRHFRLDLENHILFAKDNNYGNRLNVKIRPFQYFYLQSGFYQIVEFNKASDFPSYSVFNINFCYDRLRFQRFNLGWTAGINYVGNRTKKIGVSGGFNTNWFFLKYLSLHSSVK